MKDLRGIDLKVGDEVLYFRAGRYSEIILARVTDLKKKVKIGELVSLSRTTVYSSETLWAENTSLVVTGTLPPQKREKPIPASVTLPETSRVDLSVLYPYKPGEGPSAWTTRVLGHAVEHGTNRQCSIGWHKECSDYTLEEFASCNCICHAEGAEVYSVEGHAEGGEVTVIRVERGEQDWPPQEGEPETMWAWFVYARSETEAAVQGATKERNRLAG